MQEGLCKNPRYDLLADAQNTRRADGMAAVLNTLARAIKQARDRLVLAIAAIGLTAIISLMAWLWGGGTAFGLWLLALAAAYTLHTWTMLEAFRIIEEGSVAAAEKAGFEVQCRKPSSSLAHHFSASLDMPIQEYIGGDHFRTDDNNG